MTIHLRLFDPLRDCALSAREKFDLIVSYIRHRLECDEDDEEDNNDPVNEYVRDLMKDLLLSRLLFPRTLDHQVARL